MVSIVPDIEVVSGAASSAADAVHLSPRMSIAGVVLLGSSVRASRFHEAIGRWPLALPCAEDQTILDAWASAVASLSSVVGESVPLRILADQSPENIPNQPALTSISVDKDPVQLRGTGGVLRDISVHYPADTRLLVANASQVLLRPLPELAAALHGLHADVGILAHTDGTPTTLMLVRTGALADIATVGFVDMKEQALPMLAKTRSVRVTSTPHALTLGVRTARSYITALRSYHLRSPAGHAPRAVESWRSAFQIVEPGAVLESNVRLHDSVVLAGARVGEDSVLVRSVVAPGAVVASGQILVDTLVLPDGEQIPTEEAT